MSDVSHSRELFFLVGVVPYLWQADGAVKPEEDEERHAEVRDDVPREDAVEFLVHEDDLCLLDLKHAHHPERQVADEKEGDDGSPGLVVHLDIILGAATQAVQDEDDLQRDLHEGKDDGDDGQNADGGTDLAARDDGDEDEEEVHVASGKRDDQQHRVHGQEVGRQELEGWQARVAPDYTDSRDHHKRDLCHVEDLDGRRGVGYPILEHEEGCDGDQRENGNQQSHEQPLVRLVAVDTRRTWKLIIFI